MTREDPEQLGRYRILGELNRGAMGVVYLAEDPMLKRGVAIKIVMGGAAARQSALTRFQREAETAARLHHPNIVSIFDVGEDPDFGPYLAMEYVEGESLHDKLAKGPLPPSDVIELVAQGAIALQTAHRAGILHRDIKPGNFMVSSQGTLKLMDFGLAGKTEAYQSSGLLCTPAFASPELLGGREPSESDDRWAFTVMAFQCVTGWVPFEQPSIAGTLSAIASTPPAFPEDLDPGIAQVFQKAFAKDPSQRHGDLQSFMMDLMAALQVEDSTRANLLARLGWQDSVLASPKVAVPTPARRLPWPWLAAGLVLLAGILMVQMLSPEKMRPISVASDPPGAEVRVDGDYVGLTPLVGAQVPQDATRMELRLEGHAPVKRSIGPRESRFSVQLEPLPWELDVRSKPAGAEVHLNGQLMGKTPLDLQVPGKGFHRLALRLEGYRSWSTTIAKDRKPSGTIVLEPAPKGNDKLRQFEEKLKQWFQQP